VVDSVGGAAANADDAPVFDAYVAAAAVAVSRSARITMSSAHLQELESCALC
jgi:hypothetical protein